MNKKITIIVVLVALVLAVVIFVPSLFKKNIPATTQTEQATSTGTTSSTTANKNVTLSVGQKTTVGDLSITLNNVTQDSRCPTNVQCIQAGSVTANILLSDTGHFETKNLISNLAPYHFGKYLISIVSVSPSKISNKQILASEYKVGFSIKNYVPQAIQKTATVSGKVTLSPSCPVERMPPDPACAPKPYATSIKIFSASGNDLIKTIKSGSDGRFATTLPVGGYNFQAVGGTAYPRCPLKELIVNSNVVNADISCDTGIR